MAAWPLAPACYIPRWFGAAGRGAIQGVAMAGRNGGASMPEAESVDRIAAGLLVWLNANGHMGRADVAELSGLRDVPLMLPATHP